MTKEALLDRVVATTQLSPLFARQAVLRAFKRAGIETESPTLADLRRALPELRRTLASFLDTRADSVMADLERLARGSQPER